MKRTILARLRKKGVWEGREREGIKLQEEKETDGHWPLVHSKPN